MDHHVFYSHVFYSTAARMERERTIKIISDMKILSENMKTWPHHCSANWES